MRVVPSEAATEEDIRKFHSQEYVEFLQRGVQEEDEDVEAQDEFGLGLYYTINMYIFHLFL